MSGLHCWRGAQLIALDSIAVALPFRRRARLHLPSRPQDVVPERRVVKLPVAAGVHGDGARMVRRVLRLVEVGIRLGRTKAADPKIGRALSVAGTP